MQKKIHQNQIKKMMLGGSASLSPPVRRGLHSQAPDAFRLNPRRQLVIGYYWLAFLNQVGKDSQSSKSQFSKNFQYKINHIPKTKNYKNLKIKFAFVSEHCASFGGKKCGHFFVKILRIVNHISITKNDKKIFHRFQSIAQLFGTKTQYGHF